MVQFCRVYNKQQSINSAMVGVGKILSLPQYALLALTLSLLVALIIFFAINANFYGPLMMSRLPILDKISLFGTMFIDIFKQGFSSLNGALLLVVSLLQGLSITVVIFTAKKNKRKKWQSLNCHFIHILFIINFCSWSRFDSFNNLFAYFNHILFS